MDENTWEYGGRKYGGRKYGGRKFVAVPETGELSCEGCYFATPEYPSRTRCLRPDDTPRCTAALRKDKRNIIWVKEGVIDG